MRVLRSVNCAGHLKVRNREPPVLEGSHQGKRSFVNGMYNCQSNFEPLQLLKIFNIVSAETHVRWTII